MSKNGLQISIRSKQIARLASQVEAGRKDFSTWSRSLP